MPVQGAPAGFIRLSITVGLAPDRAQTATALPLGSAVTCGETTVWVRPLVVRSWLGCQAPPPSLSRLDRRVWAGPGQRPEGERASTRQRHPGFGGVVADAAEVDRFEPISAGRHVRGLHGPDSADRPGPDRDRAAPGVDRELRFGRDTPGFGEIFGRSPAAARRAERCLGDPVGGFEVAPDRDRGAAAVDGDLRFFCVFPFFGEVDRLRPRARSRGRALRTGRCSRIRRSGTRARSRGRRDRRRPPVPSLPFRSWRYPGPASSHRRPVSRPPGSPSAPRFPRPDGDRVPGGVDRHLRRFRIAAGLR